ncbi:hypothetical protein ETAA1_09600 [Urbifossiella limnaea]|uniref:Uncharacterized protein n=1 Tax=Urbifossiella limnaea TaxID=2528023 RepID=A0A517XNI1_9BACT|nr:hypothetical protein ETAA1_09600 [Urbifossiella limnaea]
MIGPGDSGHPPALPGRLDPRRPVGRHPTRPPAGHRRRVHGRRPGTGRDGRAGRPGSRSSASTSGPSCTTGTRVTPRRPGRTWPRVPSSRCSWGRTPWGSAVTSRAWTSRSGPRGKRPRGRCAAPRRDGTRAASVLHPLPFPITYHPSPPPCPSLPPGPPANARPHPLVQNPFPSLPRSRVRRPAPRPGRSEGRGCGREAGGRQPWRRRSNSSARFRTPSAFRFCRADTSPPALAGTLRRSYAADRGV